MQSEGTISLSHSRVSTLRRRQRRGVLPTGDGHDERTHTLKDRLHDVTESQAFKGQPCLLHWMGKGVSPTVYTCTYVVACLLLAGLCCHARQLVMPRTLHVMHGYQQPCVMQPL